MVLEVGGGYETLDHEELFELALSRNPGPSGPSEASHANTFQNPYKAKNPEAPQGRILQVTPNLDAQAEEVCIISGTITVSP